MKIGEFMDKQIEMSDRLLEAMERDYNEKDQYVDTLLATIRGLLKKLDERDEVIADLRAQLEDYGYDDEEEDAVIEIEVHDEQTNS